MSDTLVLVAMIVGIPLGVAAFLGPFAFKGMTPLAYRCSRCGGEFCRPAHHRFPAACPHCRSRNWSL